MTIRDRIHRLETRGDSFVALAEQQAKERVQAFLSTISDEELDGLEGLYLEDEAECERTGKKPLEFADSDEMMAAVHAWMKRRADAV